MQPILVILVANKIIKSMEVELNDTNMIGAIMEVQNRLKEKGLEVYSISLGREGIEVSYDNLSDWAVIGLNGTIKTMSRIGNHPELK